MAGGSSTGQKSFLKNMSWILIGNIIHAVCSFLINILMARVLTTNDNGLINYGASWIAFYNAIATFGINSIINKYTTDDVNISNSYLSTAIVFRLLSGVVGCVLVVGTIVFVNPNEKDVLIVSAIQSLAIVFAAGDTLVYWFRFKKEANIVAVLRMISFFGSAIVKVFALIVVRNIYLYTAGVVAETLLFSILLVTKYRKTYFCHVEFAPEKLKQLLSLSYPFVFSSILATIYGQTDKVMLKNMMNNDAVAYYSVAVTLAGLMSIVTAAIIEGFRPEIITEKNRGNVELYKRRLKQAYCVTFWICILYGCFITIFSKYIILILYGEKYLPAQPALALIVWYTSFSYFGTINNIYMVAEGKVKWVQVTTLVGALTNVGLNFLLIPKWGIQGAALASLLTQFLANFVTPACIPSLRPINKYILQGVFFKDVHVDLVIKEVLKRFR